MASGSESVGAIYELLYNPSYTPRRSPNCHIEKLTVDGEPTLVLAKQAEADYYDVDPTTGAIWDLLDGKKTVSEIFEEAKKFDGTLTEKGTKDVIVSLAEEGMIESTEQEIQKKRVELPSPFELDIELVRDSSKSLAGLFRVTRKLFRREALPIAVGITVLGLGLALPTFIRIFSNPSVFNLAGSAVLGFFFYQELVLLPVFAVHELAHATMCDYYGGKPKAIGTGLYYLAAFFFCDTSDSWRLPKRARIMISLAGPLSTLVISAFMVFASYFVSPGLLQNILQIGAFFGFYGTLINFSPVIETDGYYILADVLGIPNLRDEAFSLFKRVLLRLIGRSVPGPRGSRKRRRTIAIYSIFTFAWLAFFVYSTSWVMLIYGKAAYLAAAGLGSTIIRSVPFDAGSFAVNVGTLGYFGLYLVGFVVMGVVASKKIRMRGVKLETIHDKRVSAFLPVPSPMQRPQGSGLVSSGKNLARKFSRSSSVTLEPPMCVAAMKLGKVNQSLDAMRGEMLDVEQSFRSLHSRFLAGYLGDFKSSPKFKAMGENLLDLAAQFPRAQRKGAELSAERFIKTQSESLGYLLQSAFGTVWTLELSPDDYKRIRRDMLPGLVAEDLGGADLPGEVEEFKRSVVLGPDALAQLSSEIEVESKEVYRKPEVYQTTTFLEPMKSRLIFMGRTDKVQGSVVWLGGLYLYQAWISYIGERLEESALGLKSLRLASTASLTKTQASKVSEGELRTLESELGRMSALAETVEQILPKIESTYESAKNFHEELRSMVAGEEFDVGLYKPILRSNERHLEGFEGKIEGFQSEFRKVSKRMAADADVVKEENSRRRSEASLAKASTMSRLIEGFRRAVGSSAPRSSTFDAEIKLMFATTRLVYGVTVGSDVIL